MKKLFFSLCTMLIFSQPIQPAQAPSFRQMIMARIETLKQYLFQKKESIPQPINIISQPRLPVGKTTPIVFYYPKKIATETAQIVLVNAQSTDDIINTNRPSNTFDDVNSYEFSPKRQYLLVHQTSIEGIATRLGGDWLGKQANATFTTKLINANTRQEIASFYNKTIMCEFSPDETTLVIASPQKSWRERLGKSADTKGASASGSNLPRAGKRQQSPTGEILRYDLFDINSKKILKTFENVQSITYLTANKLFIKYDDDTMEIVTIDNNQNKSFFSRMFNLFTSNIQTTSTTHDPLNIRTEYDEKQKIFTLQIKDNPEQIYRSAVSYHLSPRNQYILIQQLSQSTIATVEGMRKNITGDTASLRTTTKLIDLSSGKEIATFENLVTHEFSQDESRILVLSQSTSLIAQLTSSDYLYRLYDTTKQNTELMQWDNTTQSAYFSSAKELTIIDKEGNPILYNPSTAETYKAIHQQKQKQINKEIYTKEQTQQLKKEQEIRAEKEKEEQLQDQKKQEAFGKLTPKEQVALTRDQLPKSEIAKRDAFTSPVTAVRERGLSSIKQLVSEYIWPKKPEEQPKPTQEEEFSEPEDIETWMESFAQDTTDKKSVNSVIQELSFDEKGDRNDLIKNYNQYDQPTKEKFAALFFAPPGGALVTSLTTTAAQDTNFTADIVNDHLYISDTKKPSNNAIIFTSKELDNDVKVMTFNKDASYFALSYDDNAKIEIFKQTDGKFSEFRKLNLQAPIIGLKFIETKKNNIYLFCLDKSYAIHIVDVTDQEKPKPS